MQFFKQKVFISHVGRHTDSFASGLRKQLAARGMHVLERVKDLDAASQIQAVCQVADLVIFVVSYEFMTSLDCMDELRGVLQERRNSHAQLPRVQLLLYPANKRGYTKAQLEAMPQTEKQRFWNEVSQVEHSIQHDKTFRTALDQLIGQQSLSSRQGLTQVSREQRLADLNELKDICRQGLDASLRYASMLPVNK